MKNRYIWNRHERWDQIETSNKSATYILVQFLSIHRWKEKKTYSFRTCGKGWLVTSAVNTVLCQMPVWWCTAPLFTVLINAQCSKTYSIMLNDMSHVCISTQILGAEGHLFKVFLCDRERLGYLWDVVTFHITNIQRITYTGPWHRCEIQIGTWHRTQPFCISGH